MTINIVKQLALADTATLADLSAALRKRAPHSEFPEFEPTLIWQVPLAPHPDWGDVPRASLLGFIRPQAWQPPAATSPACPMKRVLLLHDAHLEIEDTTRRAWKTWTPVADLIPLDDLANPDLYDGYPIPDAAQAALQQQRDALIARDIHMQDAYDWLPSDLALAPLLDDLGVRDDLFIAPRRIANLLAFPSQHGPVNCTGTDADWEDDEDGTTGAGASQS